MNKLNTLLGGIPSFRTADAPVSRTLLLTKFSQCFAVFCLLVFFSASASATVIISEFMASNDDTLFDEDGEAEDWIELHNTGSSAVNLIGWYLTDDEDDLTAWSFPSVTLNANEYLVVFASNKDRSVSGSELHTNFKLSAGGEYLALVQVGGITINSEYAPEYPEQATDISYGGNLYYVDPTPGAPNNAGRASLEGSLEFGLAHGFFETPQSVSLSSDLPNGTIRYTLDGSIPPDSLDCEAPADGQPWAYEYYEGTWTSLPDFDSLTPVTTGTTDKISTDVQQQSNNFALRFTGCVLAPAEGIYTFSTTSDDSSQLFVDGDLVVDNVSPGSVGTVSADIELNDGLYEVVVTYYQNNGTNQLSAEWVAPLRGTTYAVTPNEGDFFPADDGSNDHVEFEFDVPGDGQFSFIPRVQGPDVNSSSFWVQLNDGPLWDFQFSSSGSFADVVLTNNGVAVSPNLDAGEHKIKFFVQDDGARIDLLRVEALSCDGPCETQVLQAEIEDVSGDFILGGVDAEELPGQGWFTYSSPVYIDQTSTLRAIAIEEDFEPSDVVTQSYIFLDDVIIQSPNEEEPDGWPAGNVNGQDMDYGMDPDIVVGAESAVKNSILSLPSISIVTDIDNLMHPSIGIYVNALEKGRYWERPASIELIDPNGTEAGFTIDAGIRIRGGYSRRDQNPKHPFRLYFRNSYDGSLDYPLFGLEGVDSFDRVDLRSPNNYGWAHNGDARNTFLREVWARDTQAEMGHPYTRSRYYHLFINGQYWGVNMTQERVTEEYAESYFGGDKDDYDVVKHNRNHGYRYEASDGFNESWNQMWDLVADQTVTAAEYLILDQQVDIDNLIDYIIQNAYEGDLDGATSWFLRTTAATGRIRWARANNWYGVRDRVGGRLKWSFFQHDSEHSLGVRTETFNTVGPHTPFDGTNNEYYSQDYMNPYWLHASMASNPEYNIRFKDRVAEVFAPGGVLSNEEGLARWLDRKSEVSSAILAHSARWGDSKTATPFTVADWQAEVSNVENVFFADRADIVFNQLLAVDLATDIELPTVSIPTGETVESGTLVTITAPSQGTIYYTTDGSDPHDENGNPSANAIALTGTTSIAITEDMQLRIRVLLNGEWSTLVAADYFVEIEDDEMCLPIKAKNGKMVVICL